MADGIRSVLEKNGGIAGRKDSDTFYIYTPHCENYSFFFDAVNTALSSLLKSSETRLRLGAFSDAEHSYTIIERFDHALQACNSIRTKGSRNSDEICIYDKEMSEKEVFDARLLQDFESAIEQKQFKVVFQPKIVVFFVVHNCSSRLK